MSAIRRDGPVALVSLPWAPAAEPSLGLAILKASLERSGYAARVFHGAPELLRWLTIETYQFLADCWGINDFIFTGLLDPVIDEAQAKRMFERSERYVGSGRHPGYPSAQSLVDLYMTVRHEVVPLFIDGLVGRILDEEPILVGFSCMFDQTMASAAVAKVLKAERPELPIVLGGYALEGPPGQTIARVFDQIDAVICGDGEEAIVTLAENAANGRGILDGLATGGDRIARGRLVQLESSPLPDYSDWFDDLARLKDEDSVRVQTAVLPVEASRGCWWGQAKHCVFCGIDDDTLKYRFKSPGTTLEMLREMRSRYEADVVYRFSDYIMPKVYYTELLPILAQEKPRFRLQTELKANQTPDRVRQLREAGFVEIQPGIESFSTGVLRLMDKGVRGIDNVMLLKTGLENGLIVDYNFLYGIPNELPDFYTEMIENIPKIYHLQPPVSRNETVVTRFAPMHADPKRFGFDVDPRPHPCYETVFSHEFLERTGFDMKDYAYYFERYFEYGEELEELHYQAIFQIVHWKSLHRERTVELSFESVGDGSIEIVDSRYSPDGESYFLSGLTAEVLLHCGPRPTKLRDVAQTFGLDETAAGFQTSMEELDARRLIWRDENFVLALPIEKATFDEHCESGRTRHWMSVYV